MTKQIEKYRVLSIFSGIGGLDIGFEKAGFEIVATVEWDQDCCDTQKLNKGIFFSDETRVIHADITKINPDDIYTGEIDFFIGGPPCQTFSAIGRRAGGASGRLDDRGSLFEHYCRLIKHYDPKGFMFENVRGILSSNKGKDWEDVQKAFSALGYQLKYRILDAAGYGAAQHRERVILVGNKTNNEFFFPLPTHGPDSKDQISYVPASEMIKDVDHTEDVEALFSEDGKYDHLLPDVPPGLNYLFFTEEMGHPQPQFAWRSKFSDFLYKANPETPVKTIVASMGKYSGPFHWNNRKLSIGELLKLQGFPSGFTLCGGRTSKIKQIGNSVVPLLSFPLALAVKKTIFNEHDTKIDLIDDDVVLSFDSRKGKRARLTRAMRNKSANNLSSYDNNPILKAEQYFSYTKDGLIRIYEKNNVKDCEYCIKTNEKNGIVRVKLLNTLAVSNDAQVSIDIELSSKLFGKTTKLKFESNWYSSDKPYVIWDAINIVIKTISSYPSIHELYGHFTEPNPKFTITSFNINNTTEPISLLLKWMSQSKNTHNHHPLSILQKMGFNIGKEREFVKDLRAKRIDIRTNLTNKRVKAGHFRICYPYTLPVDRKSFVTVS